MPFERAMQAAGWSTVEKGRIELSLCLKGDDNKYSDYNALSTALFDEYLPYMRQA
jgi:hypothetical protein